MSELRASLIDFIPQLRDLSSMSERLTLEENVRLGQLKGSLGELATTAVKEEIKSSGIRTSSRPGSLLNSVEYDWEYEGWGDVIVNTDYASTLEYGADMKDYMLGKVVPIKTPEGVIFRTVSRKQNGLRNWVIRSYGYFEGAQHKTATSGQTVSIIDDLKELGLKKATEIEEIGAENLPDLLKEELEKEQEEADLPDLEEITKMMKLIQEAQQRMRAQELQEIFEMQRIIVMQLLQMAEASDISDELDLLNA